VTHRTHSLNDSFRNESFKLKSGNINLDDELKIELLDLLSDQQAKIEGNRKINLEIDKQIKQIQDVIDSQKIIFSIYHYHQQVLFIIAKPEMKNTGTFRLKWSTIKLAKLRKKYTD